MADPKIIGVAILWKLNVGVQHSLRDEARSIFMKVMVGSTFREGRLSLYLQIPIKEAFQRKAGGNAINRVDFHVWVYQAALCSDRPLVYLRIIDTGWQQTVLDRGSSAWWVTAPFSPMSLAREQIIFFKRHARN